jgi:hypothetical protein
VPNAKTQRSREFFIEKKTEKKKNLTEKIRKKKPIAKASVRKRNKETQREMN